MCTTCGCGSGERSIEGVDDHHDDDHEHPHDHQHDHHHAHDHSHSHGHNHSHDHGHDHEHEHDHDHHHSHAHDHACVRGPLKNLKHLKKLKSLKLDSHAMIASAPGTTIVHHHYHHSGDVHHHYHTLPAEKLAESSPLAERQVPEVQQNGQRNGQQNNGQQQQDLHYGKGEAGTHAPGMSQRRMLQIEMDVLGKNNHLAAHNREDFAARNILALNLVSSPGSGKTTLLTTTLLQLASQVPCAVIEGDQQTTHDADRIRATGVPAIQVNTGKGCHLDAQMIMDAAKHLPLQNNSLLFIENVGNLVCPAGFDLGERHKVAVLSVTEGEDKPLKYPHMFAAATLMIINKVDLLPYLDFDIESCIAFARQVNPDIQVIKLSATTGEGMADWFRWLEAQQCA